MGVNYLVEINALNDWELCHPISATAYKMLMKLYHIANRERFPERIAVSNRVLMSMVGCSEDSLSRARNQLIQTGRIDYKGQKKATPVYTMHYFSGKNNLGYNSNIAGYRDENPQISGINQGINRGITADINQGINQGYTAGYTGDIYINKNILRENDDIYIRQLAERIAEKNGHAGNQAYINGIIRNIRTSGPDGIQAAERELNRTADKNGALDYQQHTYTEADFGDDFFYDPDRDFLETGCGG